jgi:oxygen-independent coproporphyrinogen-3 oxidase
MHGLPDQSMEMALKDLSAAIKLNPSHISWYRLTLEPNTVFYARPPANMPDDDLAYEIQEQGQALLAEQGFAQYEISAYAKNGEQCRHNLNYWLFGDYLAVGAGAHGKITTADGIFRYQKPANPLQYMMSQEAANVSTGLNALTPADRLLEFMLNALRLNDGFSEDLFHKRTAISADDLMDATQAAREKGLIERKRNGIWKPSKLGARFLNDLQAEFIA